jgi:uncharacterized membrane protein YedE/YeeE
MTFLLSPTARAEVVTCMIQSDQQRGVVIKLDMALQLLYWGSLAPEPVIIRTMTTERFEIAASSRHAEISPTTSGLHIWRENGRLRFTASAADSFFQGRCATTSDMSSFTPASALIGGILIGLSATLLLWTTGRIAGISGIVGGLLRPTAAELPWRVAFILGLIAAPLLYGAVGGITPPIVVTPSLPLVILGGLLVGYGTRLSSGCTSGHGVCGLARLSPRSLAATAMFLSVALVTVFVTRHALGGAP